MGIATSDEWFRFHDFSTVFHLVSLIALGGCIAFVMEGFEYLVLAKTSSLTLSIIGVIKVRETIFLAKFAMEFGFFSRLKFVVSYFVLSDESLQTAETCEYMRVFGAICS